MTNFLKFLNPQTIFIGLVIFVLGMILIPNLSNLQELFGFETKASLREKNAALDQSLQTALDVNQSNLQEIKKIETINEIATEVIAQTKVEEVQIEKEVVKIVEKKQARIAKITPKTAPAVTNAPPVPEVAVIEETSRENVTALWEAYHQLAVQT